LDTSLPVRRMAAAATAAARQISCRLFPISLPPAALLHSRWNLLPRFLVPVRLFLTFPVPSSVRIGSELLLGGPLAQTHCKAHFSMRVESSTFLLGLPTFRVAYKLLHGLRGCDNGLWMDKIV
jgi:hypothetical protein